MFSLSLEGNVNCLCLRGRTGGYLHILIAPFDSLRRSVFDSGSRSTRLKHRKKINSPEGKFMQKQHKRMNCLCERNQYSHANEVPEVYEAVPCLNDSLWNNHVKVQLQFILPQGVLKAFFTPEFFMTKKSEENMASGKRGALGSLIHENMFCPRTRSLVQ